MKWRLRSSFRTWAEFDDYSRRHLAWLTNVQRANRLRAVVRHARDCRRCDSLHFGSGPIACQLCLSDFTRTGLYHRLSFYPGMTTPLHHALMLAEDIQWIAKGRSRPRAVWPRASTAFPDNYVRERAEQFIRAGADRCWA